MLLFIVGVLRDMTVCCIVLQCVAIWCSVLQCVAMCCSVLQCVAMCFSAGSLTDVHIVLIDLGCVGRHDSFMCVTMTHSYELYESYEGHDSFIRVTRPIRMRDMINLWS